MGEALEKNNNDIRQGELCYCGILKEILYYGVLKHNRTGVDTLSVFNTLWSSFDILSKGYFPLMTKRKINFKGALVELFWILGILQKQKPISKVDRNNIAYLNREGVKYWDKWADKNGDLGRVYGAQLCEWKCHSMKPDNNKFLVSEVINQIENIIHDLRVNPDSRRMVFSMWNPEELEYMALPPCHYAGEFYSEPLENGKRRLHLRWVQRSCDIPVGVPYDICLYSLLLVMISKMTNHEIGTVYGLFGDSHIYVNQLDGVKDFLNQEINDPPKLVYTGPDYVKKLEDFQLNWFSIKDYNPVKTINIPVTV